MVQEPSLQAYSDLSRQKQESDAQYLAIMAEANVLRSDNKRLQENELHLISENKEFAKMKEDFSKMKEDLAKTEAKLATKQNEYSSVDKAFRGEKGRHQTLKIEHGELKDNFARLERENAALKAKLDKDTSAAAWKETVKSLQDELELAQEKLKKEKEHSNNYARKLRKEREDHNKAMEENGKSFSEKLEFEVVWCWFYSFFLLFLNFTFSAGEDEASV